MVTMAPSMASMSNSLGMAMISLDFSATWTGPRTRRWRAAKADTMWIAARPLLLDRREVLPSIAITPSGMLGQGPDPGGKAGLELPGIQRGQNIAQMVVRRSAGREGAEASQQRQLFLPKHHRENDRLGARCARDPHP